MVQYRRFATFLLGAWLGISLFTAAAGFRSFRAVDRFLGAPPVESVEQIHALGRASTRVLLRHFSGEQNRWFMEQWEWAQLGLGLGLLLLLVFGSRPPKAAIGLCLLMLAIVLIERTGIAPPLFRAGRAADFLPPDSPSSDLRTFSLLQRVYSLVDLAKMGFGIMMAALLLVKKPVSPNLFAEQSDFESTSVRRPAAK